MKTRLKCAALLLSAALIGAPVLSAPAFAHEDGGKGGMSCEHEQHLSKAKQELLHTTMKKVFEDNKAVFEDMHKLMKQKHDILAAKTFDKDAFLSVEDKISQDRAQLEKAHVEAFASIASKFTPEEREHLGRMFGHHHHPHGGWDHAGWGHEGHEGWKHHDGMKDGSGSKTATPAPADADQPAPAPEQ